MKIYIYIKTISHLRRGLLLIWPRAARPEIPGSLLQRNLSSYIWARLGNYKSKRLEDEKAWVNFRQRSPILVVDWKQRKVKCLFREQESWAHGLNTTLCCHLFYHISYGLFQQSRIYLHECLNYGNTPWSSVLSICRMVYNLLNCNARQDCHFTGM